MTSVYKHFKVLQVFADHCIGVAPGYKVCRVDFATGRRTTVGRIQDARWALVSRIPLVRRLLRAEITRLYRSPGGTQFAVGKKAVFRQERGDGTFRRCFAVPRGSRPLNMCFTPAGAIYMGEYFGNMERAAVHIYRSTDDGRTWSVAYTFPEGEINHIHGLFWDQFTQRVWVATGDRENECIIASTADGFKTLDIVLRGGQEFRTCNLFFYPDAFIYATDSQYRTNEIRRVDRSTLQITTLAQISGTAIKGGQVGNASFLSTTVEPSTVNSDRYSHLWFTPDGLHWHDLYRAKKDALPAMLFQFGSIEFPEYYAPIGGSILFSGRALQKIGGKSVRLEIRL